MNQDKRHQIFKTLHDLNPEPQGELDYVNLYTLLVAVVLSAQATDIGVNKATKELFKIVTTPEEMVALGEEELISHVKTIGLYKAKAKNVIGLSKMLVELHGSEVPNNLEALEALPGVGRKTANVVLNIGFGIPTIAVDTHVFRISNRTGIAKAPTVEKVEEKLNKVVPKEFLLHAHHWLILHGRYICVARKPKCSECPIEHLCEFKEKVFS
ncbi:MAG: endonuclease III [Alphaproteobacteria bacterium]|nr:endonuclease III [Alphaproteobacteria bacterium]